MSNNNNSCAYCTMEPPPDILRIPPPPFPSILQRSHDFYQPATELFDFPPHLNDSPCKHFCDRRFEGVQYIEMPQQGTVFDDTWLLVLISSCVGVIFVGIVLATLLLKCKFNRSCKNGTISVPCAGAAIQTKNEAVRYPCAADSLQDSRVMWAALTPRGTTRHYLEEHTYETIGASNKRAPPTEHTYADPPVASSPIQNRLLKEDDKAFDNTAFVDYEEPSLLIRSTDCYQLNDVPDLNDPGMQRVTQSRPRVSSPTRIEHPNLPPLNLHPHKRSSRKGLGTPSHPSDTLLRNSIASSTYIPTI
ncbi:uncharacterized protein LOC108628390 isoform X2 [Ceratina calcarata]|uniref:Uncharacterized protein LOC108628390 isoform X2 n=1 Tax=Ceratina calcarata TaxID=156304 RepID=A0AAJ7J6B5_9HYME|nr:uncharacterized protein LOC108628390 isoform X2 [Ceratina calcarata]